MTRLKTRRHGPVVFISKEKLALFLPCTLLDSGVVGRLETTATPLLCQNTNAVKCSRRASFPGVMWPGLKTAHASETQGFVYQEMNPFFTHTCFRPLMGQTCLLVLRFVALLYKNINCGSLWLFSTFAIRTSMLLTSSNHMFLIKYPLLYKQMLICSEVTIPSFNTFTYTCMEIRGHTNN